MTEIKRTRLELILLLQFGLLLVAGRPGVCFSSGPASVLSPIKPAPFPFCAYPSVHLLRFFLGRHVDTPYDKGGNNSGDKESGQQMIALISPFVAMRQHTAQDALMA